MKNHDEAMVVWMSQANVVQWSKSKEICICLRDVDEKWKCQPTTWVVEPDIQLRQTWMALHLPVGWVSKHHEDVANHSNEAMSEGS